MQYSTEMQLTPKKEEEKGTNHMNIINEKLRRKKKMGKIEFFREVSPEIRTKKEGVKVKSESISLKSIEEIKPK